MTLQLLESEQSEKKPRKLSPVQEFVFVAFAPIWEKKYKQKYIMTPIDGKFVKELLSMNPELIDDISAIQERAILYIKDNFDGWRDARHPAWGFAKHYGRYIPQIKVDNRNFCSKCHREIPKTFGNICPECETQ